MKNRNKNEPYYRNTKNWNIENFSHKLSLWVILLKLHERWSKSVRKNNTKFLQPHGLLQNIYAVAQLKSTYSIEAEKIFKKAVHS